MSEFFSPYDADRPLMLKCSCGREHSAADHQAEARAEAAAATLRQRSLSSEFEAYSNEFIEATLVKALFPQDALRRRFLRAVGKGTAMAAISSVLPVASLQAMAQEAGKGGSNLEKKDLKIGFIPITCATPLIMAHPLGFYKQQGLNVEVTKTAGWALIRDKIINKEYDATHFLSPMPLAMSLGLGSNATPMNVASIQNINGQAITLALKHKDNRDPKNWKGFKFAIPFEFSMHNFLLRYYLAEAGLNPDTDVQLRVVPPAEMVANLRAGHIDGFLGPDPLNQPEVVLQQVLTGKFADGLGNIRNVPDRADFDPMPWQSMAVWMLTQMQRWGYIKGAVNYKQIAEKVFLLTDAKKQMKALDQKVPEGSAYPKFSIMGREFDAAKAEAYAKSFAISKGA